MYKEDVTIVVPSRGDFC